MHFLRPESVKVGQISFPKRYNFFSKEAWFKSYGHFPKPCFFPKNTARTGADLARTKRSQRVYIYTQCDAGNINGYELTVENSFPCSQRMCLRE